MKPRISGKNVLSFDGKKEKILVLKNEFNKTSKTPIASNVDPIYMFVRGLLL
tara:strand:+ start:390 stop:545 length:156 start_codon:yes stop_codon:yes gene_type:complete